MAQCPVCRQPLCREGNTARPFCSERCRTIDLGSWLREEYRIPDNSSMSSSPDSVGQEEDN
ncbi:MAG: DNA gyrase inhibitor YacG [Nitrospirales bacterium]|nr:DNA gyrase inhibitor YacG [Nitrospirales bacterium]